MRLFLVRHAQTAWNAAGRAQGFTDIELDDVGRAQALRLGEALRDKAVVQLFTSDLKRCRQTAEAIEAVETSVDPALRERSMGEWEGEPFDVVRARFEAGRSDDDPWSVHVRPPGGESVRDVWDRLEPIVDHLRASPKTTVVVSHGGASALLLARLILGDCLTARGFRFGNAAITELSRHPNGLFVMERYNDDSHLRGLNVLSGNLDGTVR